MKRIALIVNKKTETSIPARWYGALTKERKDTFAFGFFDISEGIKSISKYNILHLHHPKSAFIYAFIGKLLRKKIIYTIHGSYKKMKFLNKLCFILSCLLSDRVSFVNDILQEEMPKYLRYLTKNKLVTIYNSVDVKNVKNLAVENSLKVKRLYGIPDDKLIIFHPARFVPEKNHINIVRALKLLVDKNSNLLCIFAGDGKLRKQVEGLVMKLNLLNNVRFLGTIPYNHTLGIMRLADVFIMPSVSEGLNTAFLEALVLRRKVVISNIPSYLKFLNHLDVNPQNVNIYVCNTDYKSIYEKINLAFQSKFVFSERDYAKIDRLVDIKNMIEEYIKLYNELLT